LTRYHLAQALNGLGRVNEAKTELRRILNSCDPIPWMPDVKAYFDSLASVPQQRCGNRFGFRAANSTGARITPV
jgi:hypothetical protein